MVAHAVGLSWQGWTPVRLDQRPDGWHVDWCYTDGYEFDDPFFDQTIQLCLREPARLLFRRSSPLGALRSTGLPDGVVAHVSRCGSTLVTQLLASRGDITAWSEPPVIDQVVRAAATGSCGVEQVRAVFGEFAAARRRWSVVKLDAWTTLDLPVVKQAAPTVPVAMLVRDPLDVLVSHSRRRGYHMIPGTLAPQVLRVPPGQRLDLDEYGALVLGRILEAAHAALAGDPAAVIVDYTELPDAIERIIGHFHLPVTPAQTRMMAATAARNAKNPLLAFEPDTEDKQRAATQHMRDAVDRWARPWYERLLQLRAR
jgi:hypothetical protein